MKSSASSRLAIEYAPVDSRLVVIAHSSSRGVGCFSLAHRQGVQLPSAQLLGLWVARAPASRRPDSACRTRAPAHRAMCVIDQERYDELRLSARRAARDLITPR